MGKTATTERDIASMNTKPTHYRDGTLGVNTPFDVPVYVRVHQVKEDTENHNPARKSWSQGIKANIVELDAFTFGVKVITRWDGYGPDAVLKVFLQDSDGITKVAEYTKGEAE